MLDSDPWRRCAASAPETLSRLESRSGIIAIEGLISQRMQPGVVREFSHQTRTLTKLITSDYPVGRPIRPLVLGNLEVEPAAGRLNLPDLRFPAPPLPKQTGCFRPLRTARRLRAHPGRTSLILPLSKAVVRSCA